MRASQSSDVSIMVRPTSLMTPAPETRVLSQTRALCSTRRRTRASLYLEEKRAWCELFDASRPMSLTELQPRLSCGLGHATVRNPPYVRSPSAMSDFVFPASAMPSVAVAGLEEIG